MTVMHVGSFSYLTYFLQLSYHFLMPEIMNLAAMSQKMCNFIINDYLNMNCRITMVFVTLSTQTVGLIFPCHLFIATVLHCEYIKP